MKKPHAHAIHRAGVDKSTSKPVTATKRIFRQPTPELVQIYGYHAVYAALTARRRKLLDLYATDNSLARIKEIAAAAGLSPKLVDTQELSAHLGEDVVHQGLLLEARPLPESDIADITHNYGIVLVLDQITDPHNVGSILRTSCGFGVDAIVVTERHSPAMAGVLAKTASGALEHVTIVRVVNIARSLDQLREAGYMIVGLDSEGENSLQSLSLVQPITLVLGAEGKGLRRLTRERCDTIARLELAGPIKSLNVSNACAAALSLINYRLNKNPKV
ncbi:MAG: 23S rRNA (guanosine(2251)-2'-O)-methyltransferase RlmB [Methylocystaceae bacterium]|nr:23S rRNA (guanosine(2251)-2'-O)-methyltransferase RlmB [Methylocystaceae bacterium]